MPPKKSLSSSDDRSFHTPSSGSGSYHTPKLILRQPRDHLDRRPRLTKEAIAEGCASRWTTPETRFIKDNTNIILKSIPRWTRIHGVPCPNTGVCRDACCYEFQCMENYPDDEIEVLNQLRDRLDPDRRDDIAALIRESMFGDTHPTGELGLLELLKKANTKKKKRKKKKEKKKKEKKKKKNTIGKTKRRKETT